MEWENFLQAYPMEAKLLQEKMDNVNRKGKVAIEDKHYLYVKSRKSKYVYRIAKLDGGSLSYAFHGLGEKPTNASQTKLLEKC